MNTAPLSTYHFRDCSIVAGRRGDGKSGLARFPPWVAGRLKRINMVLRQQGRRAESGRKTCLSHFPGEHPRRPHFRDQLQRRRKTGQAPFFAQHWLLYCPVAQDILPVTTPGRDRRKMAPVPVFQPHALQDRTEPSWRLSPFIRSRLASTV